MRTERQERARGMRVDSNPRNSCLEWKRKKTFFKGLKGEGVKQLFLIIHRFCSWSFTYSLKFVTPQSVLVMLLWSFGT